MHGHMQPCLAGGDFHGRLSVDRDAGDDRRIPRRSAQRLHLLAQRFLVQTHLVERLLQLIFLLQKSVNERLQVRAGGVEGIDPRLVFLQRFRRCRRSAGFVVHSGCCHVFSFARRVDQSLRTSNPRGSMLPFFQPYNFTGGCPNTVSRRGSTAASRPTMNGRANDVSIRNSSSLL